MQFGFRRALALFVLSISLVGAALIPHPPRAEANGSGMQLEFTTSIDGQTVSIGLGDFANLSVNWGDGTIEGPLTSVAETVLTHPYAVARTYNVYISGTRLTRFGDCNPPGIDDSLTKVSSWGAFALEDLSCAFSYRYAITEVPESIPATVNNLHRAFENTGDFDQNLNGWSTANVTDMSNAFSMTAAFNNGGEPFLWNTANVQNMSKMFHYAGGFNSDVSGFDTSNVINMQYMFAATQLFNQSLAH